MEAKMPKIELIEGPFPNQANSRLLPASKNMTPHVLYNPVSQWVIRVGRVGASLIAPRCRPTFHLTINPQWV